MSVLALIAAAALAAGTAASDRAAPEPRAGGSLEGFTVTVDPGHNGGNGSHPEAINELVPIGNGETKACDTTGTETNSGYAEYRYTMNVSRRLARLLESEGAKVVLTREDSKGVGPCINERARIGNRADSDAAISVHADGGSSSGRGFHVIYSTEINGLTDDIYRPSVKLAHAIRDAYERGTGLPPSTYIGSDGLDERPDLGGLRLSDVPKVFIESGNMRNATDAAKLSSPSFRQRIAEALAAGLKHYLLKR